ncbi:cell division protein FtsK/SpoIIIE [Desulforamulus ruminis DSM 2154]|uniref:Cell division protein FtsK/SpoIIIE n=2 Tax=Desulforamulus ruminis TaxID=1564 RepID=F6DTX5_DESRL|nr:cell division protein FtsK/SpoIIIE [Desulforamulus ruminis DSM 2154]
MRQTNTLGEALETLKLIWRHREGFKFGGRQINQLKLFKWQVDLENKIPAAVLDTIDVLYPEGKPRPLLTKKNRIATGWHMIFTLQPGVTFSGILRQTEFFSDACRAHVSIELKGGFIHMTVHDAKVETYYPYLWDPTPYLEKMDLPIPIGYGPTGQLKVIDLADLPHMRVGGTTFTGKSNFLHNLFISLAKLPYVRLAVIDLALLEFSYSRGFAAFATETITALRLLTALEKEMHRRRQVLEAVGVEKIQEYHSLMGEESKYDLPYIILLIDEFAFMNPDSTPETGEKEIRRQCQSICANLAALARKVGIHLILAMQRPDMKILPGQLKANLPGALSFKTIDDVNSQIILDNNAAANLPDIKGRAIWQVGNRQQEVQVMHLPLKKARMILNQLRGVRDSGEWINYEAKRLPPSKSSRKASKTL